MADWESSKLKFCAKQPNLVAGIQLLINTVMPFLTVNYPLWWLSYLKWKFSSRRISSSCDFCFKLFQEDPSKKTLITNLSVILFFWLSSPGFFFSKLVRNFQKYFSVAEKKIHAGEKFSVTFFDPKPKNRKSKTRPKTENAFNSTERTRWTKNVIPNQNSVQFFCRNLRQTFRIVLTLILNCWTCRFTKTQC